MVYKLGEKTNVIREKLGIMLQVHASRAVNPVVFTVDEKTYCAVWKPKIHSKRRAKLQVHASRAVNPVIFYFLTRKPL